MAEGKVAQLRKMREEQWAKRQAMTKSTSTGEGTSRPSGPSGAGSASSGSRSAPRTAEPTPSKPRDAAAGEKPKNTGGSVPATATKRERALEALKPRELSEDEGICTGCGKVRALRNGKVVQHQKGLGKKCPGAGKEPKP